MNLQVLVGNLVKDPDRIELDGKSMCKLNLAVNENYTDKDGKRPVQYFEVVVWGQMAENCIKYLSKGSKLAVIGKNQTREWITKDGEKRYAHEVVATDIEFISTKKKEEEPKEVDVDGLPF